MSDEDLPEPSDRLTRPERFLAERLTSYRVFWIKMGFNILIICSFIWAGTYVQDYQETAEQVYSKMEAQGCYEFSGEEKMFEPEVRGQEPVPDDYNFSESDELLYGEEEQDPPG